MPRIAQKTHKQTFNFYWSNRTWTDLLATIVIAFLIWIPRTISLNQFVTTDEPLWLSRSANFYYSLGQRNYKGTYQNAHPGVMTMWAGTAGFLTSHPEYRISGHKKSNPDKLEAHLNEIDGVSPLDILVDGRRFIVIANTLALLLAFLFTRRLIGSLGAFVAFTFIAFDPFNIALSKLLHLDGLLSNLLLLSLTAFIYFLLNRHFLYLFVSGISAGLSWLSKSPGLAIIPIVGFISLYDSFRMSNPLRNKDYASRIGLFISPIIVWISVGIFIFVLLWPAMWVDPIETLSRVFNMAKVAAETGHSSPVFFDGVVALDGKLGAPFFYFYPFTFVWRTSPVILFGLVLAMFGIVTKQKLFKQPAILLTIVSMSIFIMIFTLMMTTGTKKFDRYILPIYAPINIISALGWIASIELIKYRIQAAQYKLSALLILSAAIGLQMLTSLGVFPYFHSYYNPIMGGGRGAVEAMQIGWGEGLEQAAQYLNSKDKSNNFQVISWYSRGSFSYFFNGLPIMLQSDTSIEKNPDLFFNSDYAVIYIHNWQRNIPASVLDYLSQNSPEYSIWINDIEYVQIYKIDK